MPDFSKSKIYKITNDYNDDIYVGSTCDSLVKRFSAHKSLSKTKDFPLYNLINEIGFERFAIKLIEDFPCEDIYQLRQQEGYWIRQFGTLNKIISGRTHKEYRETEKEKIKKKFNEWTENNKEELKQKRIERYHNNIEKHHEEMKKYRDENKEELNAKKREKIHCSACDCWFSRCGLARHNKTEKHLKAIKNIYLI